MHPDVAVALLDRAAIERELCSRHLKDYVLKAWGQIEPARPFKDNWHIDAICEHLEAVARREIRRLVINVPPGSMKSLLCGVFWPSWVWTKDAEAKWITASYSPIVSRRDAYRAQRLMESPWYQERWGALWRPNFGDWGATRYSNSVGGFRLAVTVAGGATGEHADHQLVDDPIKPLDARGARADSAALGACIEWWDETMTTRVVDPAQSTRTIIMQRLHDRDLSGHVLATGDYVHLNLPMRYEPRCVVSVPHACSLKDDAKGTLTPATPTGFKDPRREGELLWPERFPESVQAERKKELGSRGVAAQDQHRPMPTGGGIFKRDWIRYWTAFPKGKGAQMIQSWDCAFKGTDDSDFVVGQVWVKYDGGFYLIDQVRGQMGFSATCHAVIALSAKWPKAVRKLIEAKANGDAVIDALKRKVPGLIAVNPEGGKVARANAVEALWESGNVFLPASAPWVHDVIEEIVSFNGDPGRHDDQVDAMTQALVYLHGRTVGTYRDAMRRVG
jgi:predicted phage terminase large subunit-like protein